MMTPDQKKIVAEAIRLSEENAIRIQQTFEDARPKYSVNLNAILNRLAKLKDGSIVVRVSDEDLKIAQEVEQSFLEASEQKKDIPIIGDTQEHNQDTID